MKTFFIIFVILSFLTVSTATAQKLLQIEKVGSFKMERYYIGDEVIFQLAGEMRDHWFRENIVDILVDQKAVLFTNRLVKIADITKIRNFKNQGWSRGLSNNANVAAGGFVGMSLIASAFTEFMLRPASVILPGTAIVVGLIIRFIFKRKTYRMGKRRRLRVLDLNFYKVGP